jgi:hypothetical protein
VVSLIDKQKVLVSGLHLLQKKISKQIYLESKKDNFGTDKYHELIELNEKFSAFFGDDWLIAQRLNNNEYKRVKRLKDKMLKSVLSNQAIFLTLTFNDKALAETTPRTRRRYVSRFLKSQSQFYIANIDFGTDKGREHYHAVLVAQKVDYSMWRKLGAINGKRVAPSDKSNVRVSKYVAKLSNHAIKETARQVRLIYSR